jgi:hypothetical protein
VVTDSSGDVYVVGQTLASSLVMDSITITKDAADYSAGIYFQLDGSTGTVSWVKSAGSTGTAVFTGITVDTSNNLYITGHYDSSTLTIGTTTFTNAASSSDVLLFKVDSSNGDLGWAQDFGGTGGESGAIVAADLLGNLYLSFSYNSPTVVMGTTTLTGHGVAVAKVDASTGVPIWAVQSLYETTALAVDPTDSRIYVAGRFTPATIEIGAFTLTNSDPTAGSNDVYLAKLDNSTGTALAAVSYGDSSSSESISSVCVDSTGANTLVGSSGSNDFASTLTFDGVTFNIDNYGAAYVARVALVVVEVSGGLGRTRDTADWCACPV